MDRLFRIDFYPADWLVKTLNLTPEQRGIYIQIVAMIYASRGPIDNDPKWIAHASNCSPRLVRTIIAQLISLGKIEIQGSKITQNRCESELNRKRTHLEASMKGGRNSAEKRTKSFINNDIHSTEEDISVSTSSPSPIASPINSPNGLFGEQPQATKGNGHAKRSRKPTTNITEDFRGDFKSIARAAELGIDLDREQRKFIDHFLANGKLMRDWQAAFRNWVERAAEYRARDAERQTNQRSNVRDVTGAALRATALHQKTV